MVAIISGWVLLNARVGTLEAKVAEYPSQRWFELKFETIDEAIDKNTEAVEEFSRISITE